MKAVALAAACLAAAAASASAAVIEKDEALWYEVRQTAELNLVDALRAASPIRHEGRVFHGYTEWNVRWKLSSRQTGPQRCELATLETELAVKMTLPRLVESTPQGAAEFERFFPALVEHEQGHRAIALQAAQEVDRALRSLPTAPACERLSEDARRVSGEILEASKRRQTEYDLETRHGCKQGACLTAQRKLVRQGQPAAATEAR